ncbi:MAG TPA: acetate--CoA ligase family protein [Coriobacteriia bacterium]
MGLDALLSPGSIAVIGAGRQPGGVGRSVLDSLITSGFPGPVWPVNPRTDEVAGLRSFADVASLPSCPDLVVIAVPAAAVPVVVEECGQAGVGAAIVLSAGFKEAGPAGVALERLVVDSARANGMRLLGPNCLGLIIPGRRLNASFAGAMPQSGTVAVITQSGALGTAVLDWARSRGGLSGFVSLGNRADLSESDFIDAFAADPQTRVIAGYLESVIDGARFVESARNAACTTPVVLLKAGSSEAGARAVSSHTGSLAGSDAAYDAAFAAAGVLRARDTEELFGIAEAFAHQSAPLAPGLAIITNAGGPAVMATDACARAGVVLAALSLETTTALREALPPASAVYNPVDLLGDAGPERFAQALRIVARDPNVHSVLVILTPQAPTLPRETAEAVVACSATENVTTLACFMGEDAVAEGRRALIAGGVPVYNYPERAIDALSAMERYRIMAAEAPIHVEPLVADRESVAAILAQARAARQAFVLEEHAAEIARAYGIPTPRAIVARDRAAAAAAARSMGYPVALKIASPDILHKSDIGGIVLGIPDERELLRAWDSVLDAAHRRMPDAAIWGALIQQMVPPGREVIVGVQRDPTFGPLLMFGLGGIHVEVLHDVTFRLAPLDHAEARRMIESIRSTAVLHGARGAKPADVDAVADVLVRVSALVTDFPEIVELDINPLVVADRGLGAVAADIRIGIGGS